MAKRGPKPMSTEQWITLARSVHGDRYDYSLAQYKGGRERITIICPRHGPFKQQASNHTYAKHQCKHCAADTMSAEEFFSAANIKHKNKYDYTLAEYVNLSTRIIIVCPEHGSFMQAPNLHLRTTGCNICSHARRTTESWVAEATAVHNGYYDYSQVHYEGNKYKVTIICPKHGTFEQRAENHLNGHGCAQCRIKVERK